MLVLVLWHWLAHQHKRLILAEIAVLNLEERVAVLEATTARKGNRKVSLTVSGWMNQALLVWDDGHDSDAYVVSNGNDLAAINFSGEAKIRPGWTAGYEIELEIISASSDDVDQFNDDGIDGANSIEIAQSAIFISSEQYGTITWGFADQASDGAPEMDLSGAENVAYSAIPDVVGAFQFRSSAGGFTGITIGDLFDNFNGDTFNVIRYETPELAGFVLSASWGEDDMWDVALTYEKSLVNLKSPLLSLIAKTKIMMALMSLTKTPSMVLSLSFITQLV